ncbi:MAG: hypothetical protein QOE32_16 [Pseudonocardiales bacterium]|nr:hypothetical protein [Pseudonocardiales bacterium]MDT7582466.1 hypothetical protein [Pseudonocardiales bacterium]MDT7609670.1 hypothetical protein [Pseudonocardiales bacterium]
MITTITNDQVDAWVAGYLRAWSSASPKDLEAIFAEDAESYEWPYDTSWVGLAEIKEGWTARVPWQEGGWKFSWNLLAVNGDTFAIQGLGVYEKLGTFDNLWVVTLNGDGMCTTFRMWNNEVRASALS